MTVRTELGTPVMVERQAILPEILVALLPLRMQLPVQGELLLVLEQVVWKDTLAGLFAGVRLFLSNTLAVGVQNSAEVCLIPLIAEETAEVTLN